MTAASHILQAIAAGYIIFVALLALNKMKRDTRHLIYVAYLCLSAGAAFAFVSSFATIDKFNLDCILTVGIAIYLFSTQRREVTS